jgi:hypothetical protein|nr:hypothetical protein [Kofleriaceae bacterium]
MKHLVWLPLVLGAACAKTPSDDLLTHGIYADLAAQATGDGTTLVTATLYVGDPVDLNFVELQGDDQLIATHDTDTEVMTQVELGNIVGHQASFQTDMEGDDFHIDFKRTVDAGAPDSVATLPAPFTIDTPPTSASRAQDLTLTWTSADDDTPMMWSATGECITGTNGTVNAGSNALTISANTFVQAGPGSGSGAAESCTVSFAIQRQLQGTLDPGYGQGGTIFGTQARAIQFTSNP